MKRLKNPDESVKPSRSVRGSTDVTSARPESSGEAGAEVAQGFRELRLVGTAQTPMPPAHPSLLKAGPAGLAVRVVVRTADLPQAHAVDSVYLFTATKYGSIEVSEAGVVFGFGSQVEAFDVWDVIPRMANCEVPPFMCCVRRPESPMGGQEPLPLFLRWLIGRHAWRG